MARLTLSGPCCNGPRKLIDSSVHRGEATPRMCLAIPGQVMEVVDDANRLAKVDVAGVQRNVNIGLLDDDGVGAQPGDWVLIHVGFALSKVDEEEALATRKMLEGMGADYEAELEELKASVIE
jgi:hydrogenase expression/formation protein HypC